MAPTNLEDFDQVLLQLIDKNTRLHNLVMAIAFEEQPVNLEKLANKLDISKKTVANNLTILTKLGIVTRERKNTYRVDPQTAMIVRMAALLKLIFERKIR